MYSSEIGHVLMHLSRMGRDVKDELFIADDPQRDETRLIFLAALAEARGAVLRFWQVTANLSTADLP